MKKLALAAAVATLFVASQASALPDFAPDQYKFKFTDAETFVDANNNIVAGPTVGGHAIGIIDVTQILEISTNTVVWNKGQDGEYLSALFNTPTINTISGTAPNINVEAGTDGFVDLYLNNSPINFGNGTGGYTTGGCVALGGHCYNSVSNVGGSLYLTLAWAPGISDTDGTIGLSATFTAATNPLTGQASAYLDVTGGAGAVHWDTNGFATNFGNRDFFLQNDFCTPNTKGSCPATGGNWQLHSEDPTVGNFVPEPASLALLGIGLAGLGAFRRRRG